MAERKPLADSPALTKAMSSQEERLGDRGRILVRYSGTEPLLRIMVEAEDQALMNDAAQALKEAALLDLGQG